MLKLYVCSKMLLSQNMYKFLKKILLNPQTLGVLDSWRCSGQPPLGLRIEFYQIRKIYEYKSPDMLYAHPDRHPSNCVQWYTYEVPSFGNFLV